MTLNLAAPLRTALVDDAAITALLGQWNDEPSVFTRTPVPADAEYPMIRISPDVAVSDQDGLNVSRPVLVRDIIAYGHNAQGDEANHFRDIEALGYMLRLKFHRNRFALSPDGYRVIQINASGPVPAPTDDDKTVARMVTLTIQVQPE